MNTDYLEILVERTSYLNTYWNFYIVVSTAVIGTIASGKIHVTKTIRVIITVAFVLFAASNLHAILNVNEQRVALIKLIPASQSTIADTLKPNDMWQYIFFHVLLDSAVFFAVWRINQKEGGEQLAEQSKEA